MARLKLYLLGTFRVTLDGQPLDGFRSDKSRALLAYLALSNNLPIQRAHLATFLWEGYQPGSALASLRVTLNNLRQILAPLNLLQLNRRTAQLKTTADTFWCDALALEQALHSGENHTLFGARDGVSDPTQTTFLIGCERVDSPPFQRWLEERRAHYQQQCARWYAPQTEPVKLAPNVGPNNLPRVLTPLIGRETEIDILYPLLQNSRYPLITLMGEGGIGKTRLALAVAQAILDFGFTSLASEAAHTENQNFPDGVWFVPLAGVTAGENLADHLAVAIGEALQIRFSGAEPLTDQLCRYLHRKHALLVLDNFEQLVEGAEWLVTLLQRTTALKLLVTSRQRLNLEAEYVFRLEGLATPEVEMAQGLRESNALQYSSVQLFIDRAVRSLSGFQLTSENQAEIVHICRFVEGLPLGIVLAATLLEEHDCRQIAAMLHENYRILSATLRDLPPRQRNIHAVLEASWQLLTPAERTILAQCAVFRDTFTTEAANHVANATLAMLTRLEAKSLLRLSRPGHYELHELVRQYAATQLYPDPTLMHEAYKRHCQYYLDLVQQQEAQLPPSAHTQALIREALTNIRAAWTWATKQGYIDVLAQNLPALARFYGLAGLQREAASSLAETVASLRPLLTEAAKPSQTLRHLFTELLLEQAYFQVNIAQADQAERLVEEALQFLPELADPLLEVTAYIRHGDVAWAKGDYTRHRAAYERSLAQAEASGWQLMIAHSLTNLGMNYDVNNDYAEAIMAYQAALSIAQQIDHKHQANIIYNNLGVSHELLGDFSAALHYYQQTLQVSRELGDQEGGGIAHLNLGIVLTTLGDWENAQAHLARALQTFRQGGHQRLEAKTLAHLALLCYNEKNDQSAAQHAQLAREIAQRGGFQAIQAEALTVIGHILARQQHHAEAVAAYTEALTYGQPGSQIHRTMLTQSGLALSLFAQADRPGTQRVVEEILHTLAIYAKLPTPGFVFLTCYQLLAALHDARSDEILQRGYQALQEQAATITDPALHSTFLTNVAANRELIALATTRPASQAVQNNV